MECMKALTQDLLGGPEVLKVVETDVPEPGIGQVLIKVRAAVLNPADWYHRAREVFKLLDLPFTLGWDVSGVVEKVGVAVSLYKPGDEVFGLLPYPEGKGAHAEYVTGPTRAFVRKPANLTHQEAAAIPLAGLTAWQALVDTAGVQPGQRVLIHAAAGGVGHFAVQIAKALGAYVIGTASVANHGMVLGLGADEMIDYHTTDFESAVSDVDVVLETIGGENAVRSMRTLRPGGLLMSIKRNPPEIVNSARDLGLRYEFLRVEYDHAGMDELRKLAEEGKLRPVIARTFPLAEAAKAHALGEADHVAGKLVFVME
jgi:NADPH:quinone reductase-like Zn-dependent oxidoreductase